MAIDDLECYFQQDILCIEFKIQFQSPNEECLL